MKPGVKIGQAGLDDHDLVVLKSALKLREEEWLWVDSPAAADVWITDAARPGDLGALATLDPRRLLVVADDLAHALPDLAAQVLAKPLKAVQLLRALDKLLAARTPNEPPAAASSLKPSPASAAMPTASPATPATHPWQGRRMRLLRGPNLARYPVTAEMVVWFQTLTHKLVSYETLLDALPLDRDLLHTILDQAAHDGHLVDERGAALRPLSERKEGVMARLFGRQKH